MVVFVWLVWVVAVPVVWQVVCGRAGAVWLCGSGFSAQVLGVLRAQASVVSVA